MKLLAILMTLMLPACQTPPPPGPLPRPVAHAPAPPPEPITCPGGLLCEARTQLLGWRIPVGCEPELARAHVAACFLADAQVPKVTEFFRSRYRVEVTPEGLWVHPNRAPLPGTDPPLLQVLTRPQGVELVALAGAGTEASP